MKIMSVQSKPSHPLHNSKMVLKNFSNLDAIDKQGKHMGIQGQGAALMQWGSP